MDQIDGVIGALTHGNDWQIAIGQLDNIKYALTAFKSEGYRITVNGTETARYIGLWMLRRFGGWWTEMTHTLTPKFCVLFAELRISPSLIQRDDRNPMHSLIERTEREHTALVHWSWHCSCHHAKQWIIGFIGIVTVPRHVSKNHRITLDLPEFEAPSKLFGNTHVWDSDNAYHIGTDFRATLTHLK